MRRMKGNRCRSLSRKDFFSGNDYCFKTSTEATFAVIYIPQELLTEAGLTQDEKEQVIFNGWNAFLDTFECGVVYAQMGWCVYYLLISCDTPEDSTLFKRSVTKINKAHEDFRFWRVILTELDDPFNQWSNAVREIEWRGRKFFEQNKNQRLIFIDIQNYIIKPLSF